MEQKNKTIQIFLASSNEMKDDREAFGNFIRSLDNQFSFHRTVHRAVPLIAE